MKPYPYGTQIKLIVGGRHDLREAYVIDSCTTSGGQYRYRCLFPYQRAGIERAWWGSVYSDEIEQVGEIDERRADNLLTKEPYR